MHISLILYAEHEFNASTFTGRVVAGTGSDMYSCMTAAIGALRGPKHGGANEAAFETQSRYSSADEAEADIRERVANKEIVIGFGHPVYTVSDPRNEVIKRVAKSLSAENDDMLMYEVAARLEIGDVGPEEHVSQPGLVFRGFLQPDGGSDRHVHAVVRHRTHLRLGRACRRTAYRRQDHPPIGQLHRSRRFGLCPD